METRRLKTFWRRTLYVVAAIVAIGVLFIAEEHLRGRIMLDRWMKQMRARGEHFTLAEVLPAAPRPDDNAAPFLAPFPAGKVIPQSIPQAMRYIAPGKAVAVPLQREWLYGSSRVQFTTNGFRASNSRNRRNSIPSTNGLPYSICRAADLEADLELASNALASVKFGLRKSGLDFGIDYSAGLSMSMMHLTPMRASVQWLRAASLHALMQTNLPAALDHLRDLTALVRLQTNGVMLIEQLVRFGNAQVAAGATWEALQVEGWNDDQLAALQASWDDMEFGPWLARAGETERIMGGIEIDRMAETGPDRLMSWMGTAAPPAPPAKSIDDVLETLSHLDKQIGPALFRGIYFPLWHVAWKDQDKLNLYKSWQTLVDASRLQTTSPNWKAREATFRGSDEKAEGEGTRSIRFLVSRLLEASQQKTARRAVEAETCRTLVQTVIALHRSKLKNGNFPKSLDELVPAFLPKVPVDPFDGQALRYRVGTNASFVLYSVGHNGADDGGDARPEMGSNPNFIAGRDIVWPVAATREEIEAYEQKPR